MFEPKTILAATDLTRRSAAVPARAAEIARAHDARLVLVHVLEPAKTGVARLRLGRKDDRLRRAQSEMGTLRAQFPDIEITCRVVEGNPAKVIPELADKHGADLIVLGLHLPRRVLETLRLSNLERITQATRCPVLIAHNDTAVPYRRALGAITFAPASARALRVAARLAPEAELHAIHALQMPFAAKRTSADLMKTPEMTKAELLRDAFMALDGRPEHLHLPEIVPGGVHEVLQFRIGELQPDLVVIGSHSGRDPENLGNYARDLMRAPPTDMLVAKPG
ncbi:MAG: universal stress protein [Rhodobacteraceae bacterium]|nr:MAG: universal stress protein [Paracoccaceae bacterium]